MEPKLKITQMLAIISMLNNVTINVLMMNKKIENLKKRNCVCKKHWKL